MDWRFALDAFGRKAAFGIAEAHRSQLHTEYVVQDFGPCDHSLFRLAFTTVGADAEKNDFFKHIVLSGTL